jgi:hypothetical protein
MPTNLEIRFEADIKQLTAALAQARGDLAKLTQASKTAGEQGANSFTGLQGVINKLPPGIGAVTAGFLSAEAIMSSVGAAVSLLEQRFKSFLDTGDRLSELAEKTGLSVEQLSAYGYAADQSDASLDVLATGMKKLSINLDAADEEGKKAVAMFARLGLQTQDAAGQTLPLAQLLPQIADKFAQINSPIQKTAIATALFGREGQALVPLLSKGSAGIKELTDKAQQLGIVMGQTAAEAADKLKDKLSTLDQVKAAGFNAAFAQAAPELEKLIDLVTELKVSGGNGDLLGGIIGSGAEAITDTIEGLRVIGAAFAPIIDVASSLVEILSQGEPTTIQVADAAGEWRKKLEATALELAAIIDLLQKTFGVVQGLGAVIISAVVYPFAKALELAGLLANTISSGTGDGLVRAGQAAAGYTAELRKAAVATISNADAVDKVQRKIAALQFDEIIRKQERGQSSAKPAGTASLRGAKSSAANGSDQAKQLADAQYNLTKTSLEAEQKLLEFALAAGLSAYDTAYKEGLIGLQGYYTARESIERERLAGVVRLRQAELAAVNAKELQARRRGDAPGILKAQADVVKVQAEVQLAQGGLDNLAFQIEQAKRVDAKLLDSLKLKAQIDLAQLEGNSLDRATIEADLREQMKELLTKFAQDPLVTAKLEKIITLKADASQVAQQLQQIELRQRQSAQPLEAQSALANARVQNGTVSQPRAQQQLDVIKAGQVQQLQLYVAKLQEMRIALDQGEQSADKLQQKLDLDAKIATVAVSIEGLKAPVLDLGVTLENSFASSADSAFESILTGSKSAGAAFSDMTRGILQDIARVIVKMLVLKAVQAATGGFANGGAVGANAQAFAFGGSVHGPGGPRDDAIPAWLSNGEHVMDVPTVAAFGGHGFFNALRAIGSGKGGTAASNSILDGVRNLGFNLNALQRPPSSGALRLADGGPVASLATAQSQALQLTQNFHVSGAADQRTQSQIGSAAFDGARRATMRNN